MWSQVLVAVRFVGAATPPGGVAETEPESGPWLVASLAPTLYQ